MGSEEQSRQFLVRLCHFIVLVTLGICAFNVFVDPYQLFNSRTWRHINERKTTAQPEASERALKSQDVLKEMPRSIILGTSTVDIGLDALDPGWPVSARPVYNLGLIEIDLNGSYRYLQYVLRFNRVDLVVIGIDFDQFLGRWVIPLTEQERLRLVSASLPGRIVDFVRASSSYDALADSLITVTDNFLGIRSSFVAGNYPSGDRVSQRTLLGPQTWFGLIDILDLAVASKQPTSPSRIEDLRAVLQLCHQHRIKTIVLINPTHAHLLETYSLLGYWERYEEWKRSLVSTVAEEGGDGSITLWDFSGYDKYSTLDLPDAAKWYWDPVHYTIDLGSLIVLRLFGRGDTEFGVELLPENVSKYLEITRERQQQYRRTHQNSVEDLRIRYEIALKMTRG